MRNGFAQNGAEVSNPCISEFFEIGPTAIALGSFVARKPYSL